MATTLTSAAIEQFLDFMSAQGASPETVRAYRTDLKSFLSWVPEKGRTGTVLQDQAAHWLTLNRANWSPKTTRRRLSTLRSWAKWAGMPTFLADYRPPTPAPSKPHPIPEGMDGVLRMVMAARNPQETALVALTGMLGLRISEALSVRPRDFSGDVSMRRLRIRGKGDKERDVPVSDRAWEFIEPASRLAPRGGRIVPLSDSAGRRAITRLAKQAGLARRVASHDMRHTFGAAAFDRSKNLRAVQELLGHADAKTTQVYTGVTEAAKRLAAEVV